MQLFNWGCWLIHLQKNGYPFIGSLEQSRSFLWLYSIFDRLLINNDAVFFPECRYVFWVESSGAIKFFKIRPVEQVKNITDVSGISGWIQLLESFNCLFCLLNGLSVNRRAAVSAFPQGVELPAAKWTDVIYQAGIIRIEERAPSNGSLFFFFHVFDNSFT